MFRFLSDDTSSAVENPGPQVSEESSTINISEIKEVHINNLSQEVVENVPVTELKDFGLANIQVAHLLDFVDDESVKTILKSTSDLVSGVYEGGFKIWECTFDLIDYLKRNPTLLREDMKVLDLGCGAGLLGCHALKTTGCQVHFQDFNAEVLEYVTMPNSILNSADDPSHKCRYFAGDWKCFQDFFTTQNDRKYDVILSSETIYNLENLTSLIRLVKTCLKPDGNLLLAAKTFYFGVGGGTQAFKDSIDSDGDLQWTVLHTLKEGILREIIQVTFKDGR